MQAAVKQGSTREHTLEQCRKLDSVLLDFTPALEKMTMSDHVCLPPRTLSPLFHPTRGLALSMLVSSRTVRHRMDIVWSQVPPSLPISPSIDSLETDDLHAYLAFANQSLTSLPTRVPLFPRSPRPGVRASV
jgi:hypothetical protein